ncbi:hypothetical protein [Massilia niastensis]|uniref:hypothetical protein n=1 Tax=Massilia niastensis TaxID=544911 RepID=UPI0012EB35E0|nr:hypothetical protein [Massilia niastensis]
MTPTYQLTPWQKKQAALLYYFSSMEYLKGLQERLHALMGVTEDTVRKSRKQGRNKNTLAPLQQEPDRKISSSSAKTLRRCYNFPAC